MWQKWNKEKLWQKSKQKQRQRKSQLIKLTSTLKDTSIAVAGQANDQIHLQESIRKQLKELRKL